jgi:hypothetical protein
VRATRRAQRGLTLRGHWLRAAVLAGMVVVSLLMPSAGRAVPVARTTPAASALSSANPGQEFARLEARAAKLSRQYRGQVVVLAGAESAARTTIARARRASRRLSDARQHVGQIAAASYIGVRENPTVLILGGGSGQRMLRKASTLEYLARQRTITEQSLSRLVAAEQRAEQAAQAKITDLRHRLTALTGQRRHVAALMAKFRPQSPVIGDNITPRMRQVKDAVDLRFGPFGAIGCYRAGGDGEHPLSRACDFMLSSGGVLPTSANVQRGYAIAAWAQANAAKIGIMYIIYRQKIWDIRMASAGWVPMPDRGSITANHFDHVHISVF